MPGILLAEGTVFIGAVKPFHANAEASVAEKVRTSIQKYLESSGFKVSQVEDDRPTQGGDYFLTVFYSRSKSGNVNLFGQIYDPATGYVIDALSVSEEYLDSTDLKIPLNELRNPDDIEIGKFSEKLSLKISGNPRKAERSDNIQEHVSAIQLGKEIQFPLRKTTPGSSDAFRVLEDQVVVTATGNQTRKKDAPAAIYVITDRQIKERGYRTLIDALADTPGFDIIHTYGIFPDLVHQRGLVGNNQRTLVYVDGILDNNLTEQAALGGTLRFPLQNVDRIEVIGGPASALYGANAFSGVINIITKDGQTDPSSVASLNGGWYEDGFKNPGGGTNLSTRGFKKIEDTLFQYSVAANYYKTAGPYFGDSNHFDKPAQPYDGRSYDGIYWLEQKACGGTCSPNTKSLGYWWSPYYNQSWEDTYNITAKFTMGEWRFETINWQYLQGYGTFANGTQQVDTDKLKTFRGSSWDFRNNSASIGNTHAFGKKLALDSDVTVRHTELLSSSHDQVPNTNDIYYYYRPGDFATFESYARPDYSYEVKERLKWDQSKKANLTAGIESSYTNVPSDYGSSKRFNYVNNAGYLQQIVSPISWLQLTAGYRYDYSTIYGVANTPRIGAVVTPTEDLTFKALVSGGFRAPTAWELFNTSSQRKANPDLKPEHLRAYEFGVGYRFFKKYYVSVTEYYNHLTNLILEVKTADPNPKGGTWNQNQNVGKADIYGTEVETDLQILKSLSVFLNYTYNQGTYHDLSSALTNSPSTSGRPGDDPLFDLYAALTKQFYKQFLNLDRTPVPSSGEIPNIARHHANGGITWHPLKNLSIHAGAGYVDIRRTIATNPSKSVPGYTMATLNVRWEDAFTDGLFFSFLVKNAMNEQYFDPGIRTAEGSYYPTQHPIEKRNIWLSAGYKF